MDWLHPNLPVNWWNSARDADPYQDVWLNRFQTNYAKFLLEAITEHITDPNHLARLKVHRMALVQKASEIAMQPNTSSRYNAISHFRSEAFDLHKEIVNTKGLIAIHTAQEKRRHYEPSDLYGSL
jgi:hypothetical protein